MNLNQRYDFFTGLSYELFKANEINSNERFCFYRFPSANYKALFHHVNNQFVASYMRDAFVGFHAISNFALCFSSIKVSTSRWHSILREWHKKSDAEIFMHTQLFLTLE